LWEPLRTLLSDGLTRIIRRWEGGMGGRPGGLGIGGRRGGWLNLYSMTTSSQGKIKRSSTVRWVTAKDSAHLEIRP